MSVVNSASKVLSVPWFLMMRVFVFAFTNGLCVAVAKFIVFWRTNAQCCGMHLGE